MPQGILSLCTATKMGLTDYLNPFGWSSSSESKRAEEVRAGTRAPDRTERKKCWEARDGYFACLDKNGILDALKDEKAAAKACGGENVVFERDCAREWVSCFDIAPPSPEPQTEDAWGFSLEREKNTNTNTHTDRERERSYRQEEGSVADERYLHTGYILQKVARGRSQQEAATQGPRGARRTVSRNTRRARRSSRRTIKSDGSHKIKQDIQNQPRLCDE